MRTAQLEYLAAVTGLGLLRRAVERCTSSTSNLFTVELLHAALQSRALEYQLQLS
ncbi:MAG: hypothetical protein LLG14_24665 [Nocardiaceae bacterium]|nr:hypothetical protein [Nocardiaceae bacterium]